MSSVTSAISGRQHTRNTPGTQVRKIDHEAVKPPVHAVMNSPIRRRVESNARRFVDRWDPAYLKAVTCLRDDLLTFLRSSDWLCQVRKAIVDRNARADITAAAHCG